MLWKYAKKEHKKFKKIIVKNDLKVNSNIDENVPSSFNKEQEKNSEGLAELNDMLKESK